MATQERARFTAYDFATCLLAAVTRRTFTGMWASRSDLRCVSDVAAAAAWRYIEEHNEEIPAYYFSIETHRVYRCSPDWQAALDECENNGFIVLLTPPAARSTKYWYRFDADFLQETAAKLPGTDKLWDAAAGIFIETIDKEEPFALTAHTF